MKSKTINSVAMAALSILLLGALVPSASAAGQAAPAVADATPELTVLTDDLKGIVDQPTIAGKLMSTIKYHDGRVYVGYGDYNANTGPIDLYSYDAVTGESKFEVKIPTEDIDSFSEIGGKLYAPYIDPDASTTAPVGFASNRDGEWKNFNYKPMIHVFDVASTDGKNLFMSGSIQEGSRYYAGIWYSADGETNWELTRKVGTAPVEGSTTYSNFDRYYWLEAEGGKLYAMATITGTRHLDVWENGRWSSTELGFEESNTLAGGGEAPYTVLIGNSIVTTYQDYTAAGQTGAVKNKVYSISENKRVPADRFKVDTRSGVHFVELEKRGDVLYGITGGFPSVSGDIYSTKDGVNWKFVMSTGATQVASFSVDTANSKVYIGTGTAVGSKATIYVMNVPKLNGGGDGDGGTGPGGNPGAGSGGGLCIIASSDTTEGKGSAGGAHCAALAETSE